MQAESSSLRTNRGRVISSECACDSGAYAARCRRPLRRPSATAAIRPVSKLSTRRAIVISSSTPARASSASASRSTAPRDIADRADALSLGSRPGPAFLAPLYRPGTAVTVWAPRPRSAVCRYRDDVRIAVLSGAVRSPAVTAGHSHERTAGHVEINGFEVWAHPLNHPGGAFAYRIAGADGDLVYATDHEFGNAGHRSRARALLARRPRADSRRALHTGRNAGAQGLGAQRLVAVRAVCGELRREAVVAVSSQARQVRRRRDEPSRGCPGGCSRTRARRRKGKSSRCNE